MDIPTSLLLKTPIAVGVGDGNPIGIFMRIAQAEMGRMSVKAATRIGSRLYVLMMVADDTQDWRCGFFEISEGIGNRTVVDFSEIHLFVGPVSKRVIDDPNRFRRFCRVISPMAVTDRFEVFDPEACRSVPEFGKRTSLLAIF